MEKKLYHAVAYYPELWDESFIKSDIEYMKQAGINCVRMAEFAWHFMEPEQDNIDVSFFVKVADILYENGIDCIICTPTATPPVWVTHNHPERLIVTSTGQRYIHGGRQHVCYNDAFVRRRSYIIIEALAKAFAHHPGVIAWQIDNEMKASNCMCDGCRKLWHKWLEQRYKTIDELNRQWGTEVWSQAYNAFDQVVRPFDNRELHNPSLLTEYRRFSRQTLNSYVFGQADIIRKYSKAPITHDIHTSFHLDSEGLFNYLDFTSMNGYTGDDGYNKWLYDFDFYRGIRSDGRFFVTETSPNHASSTGCVGRPHRDGFLEIEALGSYASGGFGFAYWHFKQHRCGCELPHGSLISAWNKPTTGFYQAQKVEKIRKAVEPAFLATTHVKPQVAMTYSEQARSFFESEPVLEGGGYFERMFWLHGRMQSVGLNKDLIPEGAPLDGYKLLFTPLMPYVSKDYTEKAVKFVNEGGIWLIGPMTGSRGKYHTVNTDCCLGEIETLAGVRVEFYNPMSSTGANIQAFGQSVPACLQGGAVVPLDGTSVKGVIKGGLTDGYACLTERKMGKGKIVLLSVMPQVGTMQGDKLMETIISHYALEAGVNDTYRASEGVVIIPREGNGKYKKVVTVINGSDKEGWYQLDVDGVSVFNSKHIKAGRNIIAPFGYEVLHLFD